jgi:hypothetical protein
MEKIDAQERTTTVFFGFGSGTPRKASRMDIRIGFRVPSVFVCHIVKDIVVLWLTAQEREGRLNDQLFVKATEREVGLVEGWRWSR